jgi:hypothetical protein
VSEADGDALPAGRRVEVGGVAEHLLGERPRPRAEPPRAGPGQFDAGQRGRGEELGDVGGGLRLHLRLEPFPFGDGGGGFRAGVGLDVLAAGRPLLALGDGGGDGLRLGHAALFDQVVGDVLDERRELHAFLVPEALTGVADLLVSHACSLD